MAGETTPNDTQAHNSALSLDWGVIFEAGLACVTAGMILTGAFFVLAGALGILRMPDFFTRIHAAGMTDTLGAELILLALTLQALAAGNIQMALKLLLVAFFLFLTSPTATHAIAHAANKSGVKPLLGDYKSPSLSELKDKPKEDTH